MDNFVVSARKYRPITFKQVVGQESITSTLKNAIKNNHLAQAFLFTGPRGVGKTTCARILAKTINCENLNENIEACDQCESCKSFNENASFNIHELDAASNNSVDDIRKLVDQVRIPPQVGRYKVYIIDEVHMLSAAAFNAFLKTLEEPPAYAKFILATTEKHKILPTILSRCQIFDFRRISVEDIAAHLLYVAQNENIDAEAEALNIIAQKADGALRDGLSTFDQIVSYSGNKLSYKDVIDNLNILDYEYYFRVTDQILSSSIPDLMLVLDEILENGFDGQHFINGLMDHFRNLLILKNQNTVKLLHASDKLRVQYMQQSQNCNAQLLIKSLEICNKADLSYKASNNKRLHIEIALMQLGTLMDKLGGFIETPVNIPPKKNLSIEAKPDYSSNVKNTEPEVYKQIEKKAEVEVENKIKVEEKVEVEKQAEKEIKVENDVIVKEDIIPDNKIETKPIEERKSDDIKAEQSEDKPQDSAKQTPKVSQRPKDESGRKIRRISITESLNALKKEKEKSAEETEEVIETEFSQQVLEETWNSFVKSYHSTSPSYASAIGKYKPALKENFQIQFTVDNAIIAQDVLNQSSLLEFLKKNLKNNQITLKSVLPEKQEKKKAYFDSEKYEELAKEYPNVQKLKDQLNLEFGA